MAAEGETMLKLTLPLVALLALALAVLSACADDAASPSAASPTETAAVSPTAPPSTAEPIIRVERTFSFEPPWQAECEGGPDEGGRPHDVSCGVPSLFSVEAETPGSAPRVDVVFTVTLDYETKSHPESGASEGEPADWANIAAFFSPDEPYPGTEMQPSGFELRSSALHTPETATFSWTEEGLEAAGQSYSFRISVAPRDGEPPDGFVLITGTKATAVIEMWPAGP